MSILLNPGPSSLGPYVQPNTANPTPNAAVASTPTLNGNVLMITKVPRVVESGLSAKDDPTGKLRAL